MGNIFRSGTPPSIPAKYYIGLSNVQPSFDGSNIKEPALTGTGYARVQLTSLSAPNNGAITNNSSVQFNESETDWFPASAPARYYLIFDAQTGGNLLMFNELTSPRIIEMNTIVTIKPSSLSIQLLD